MENITALPPFPTTWGKEEQSRLDVLEKQKAQMEQIYAQKFTPEAWAKVPAIERVVRGFVSGTAFERPIALFTPWRWGYDYGLTPEIAADRLIGVETEYKELLRKQTVLDQLPFIEKSLEYLALLGTPVTDSTELKQRFQELNTNFNEDELAWVASYAQRLAQMSREDILKKVSTGPPITDKTIEEWLSYAPTKISPTQLLSSVAFSQNNEEIARALQAAYPPATASLTTDEQMQQRIKDLQDLLASLGAPQVEGESMEAALQRANDMLAGNRTIMPLDNNNNPIIDPATNTTITYRVDKDNKVWFGTNLMGYYDEPNERIVPISSVTGEPVLIDELALSTDVTEPSQKVFLQPMPPDWTGTTVAWIEHQIGRKLTDKELMLGDPIPELGGRRFSSHMLAVAERGGEVLPTEKISLASLLRTFGQSLRHLPRQWAATILTAMQGKVGWDGASVVNKDWADKYIDEANEDIDKFVQDVAVLYPDESFMVEVAQSSRNLAYSLTSMGIGLLVGIPIGIATRSHQVGRIIAWSVGTATSGVIAFRITSYQIMQQYLELMNDKQIRETGRGLTLEEENKLKQDFSAKATQYGLWEAIPEAAGNLLFAQILVGPLGKMIGGTMATQIVNKLAMMYGEEVLTETITQKGQVAIEAEVGLREGKIGWWQAFKEVAPQTFILTTIMGSSGQVIGSSSHAIDKIKASLSKEIGENHPLYKTIVQKIDTEVREELEAAVESAEVNRAQEEIAAERWAETVSYTKWDETTGEMGSDITEKITNLENKIGTANDDIENLTKKLPEYEARLDKAEVIGTPSEIREATEFVTAIKEQIANLEADKAVMIKQLTNLREEAVAPVIPVGAKVTLTESKLEEGLYAINLKGVKESVGAIKAVPQKDTLFVNRIAIHTKGALTRSLLRQLDTLLVDMARAQGKKSVSIAAEPRLMHLFEKVGYKQEGDTNVMTKGIVPTAEAVTEPRALIDSELATYPDYMKAKVKSIEETTDPAGVDVTPDGHIRLFFRHITSLPSQLAHEIGHLAYQDLEAKFHTIMKNVGTFSELFKEDTAMPKELFAEAFEEYKTGKKMDVSYVPEDVRREVMRDTHPELVDAAKNFIRENVEGMTETPYEGEVALVTPEVRLTKKDATFIDTYIPGYAGRVIVSVKEMRQKVIEPLYKYLGEYEVGTKTYNDFKRRIDSLLKKVIKAEVTPVTSGKITAEEIAIQEAKLAKVLEKIGLGKDAVPRGWKVSVYGQNTDGTYVVNVIPETGASVVIDNFNPNRPLIEQYQKALASQEAVQSEAVKVAKAKKPQKPFMGEQPEVTAGIVPQPGMPEEVTPLPETVVPTPVERRTLPSSQVDLVKSPRNVPVDYELRLNNEGLKAHPEIAAAIRILNRVKDRTYAEAEARLKDLHTELSAVGEDVEAKKAVVREIKDWAGESGLRVKDLLAKDWDGLTPPQQSTLAVSMLPNKSIPWLTKWEILDSRHTFEDWQVLTGKPFADISRLEIAMKNYVDMLLVKWAEGLRNIPGVRSVITNKESINHVEQEVLSRDPESGIKPSTDLTDAEQAVAEYVIATYKKWAPVVDLLRFLEAYDNSHDVRVMAKEYVKEGHKPSDELIQRITLAKEIYETRGETALYNHLLHNPLGVIEFGYVPRPGRATTINRRRALSETRGGRQLQVRQLEDYAPEGDGRGILRQMAYIQSTGIRLYLRPYIREISSDYSQLYDKFENPLKFRTYLERYFMELQDIPQEGNLFYSLVFNVYNAAAPVIFWSPFLASRNYAQFLATNPHFAGAMKALTVDYKNLPADVKLRLGVYFSTIVDQTKPGVSELLTIRTRNDALVKSHRGLNQAVEKTTLYPSSDKLTRLASFNSFFTLAYKALEQYEKDGNLGKFIKNSNMEDLNIAEQDQALVLLARDSTTINIPGLDEVSGGEAACHYIAEQITNKYFGMYQRVSRSYSEWGLGGRIFGSLLVFPKTYLQVFYEEVSKLKMKEVATGEKFRIVKRLSVFLLMGAIADSFASFIFGRRRKDYNPLSMLSWEIGGLSLGLVQDIFGLVGDLINACVGTDEEKERALNALPSIISRFGDTFIGFYRIGMSIIEAAYDTPKLDVGFLRKVRAWIDKDYTPEEQEKAEWTLLEKLQHIFADSPGQDETQFEQIMKSITEAEDKLGTRDVLGKFYTLRQFDGDLNTLTKPLPDAFISEEYGMSKLVVFHKTCSDAWAEYYALPTIDPEVRMNYRRANLDVEAMLLFWGKYENPVSGLSQGQLVELRRTLEALFSLFNIDYHYEHPWFADWNLPEK